MRFQTKSILVLATAAMLGTTAMAQTAAPAAAPAAAPSSSLSFNVGVVSDYRFRSVAQTSFKPALQGGVDFSHTSGFYAGAWGSNVSWIKDYVGASEGTLEVDLYGGFKGEITSGLSFDVGVITYQYPGNTADRVLVNANTTEVYGALTFGVVTVKYSHSTGNFIANPNSSGASYLEAAAAFDLGNGFSLTPHVGRQTIPNQGGNGDYTDFSLTLGKDFGNGLSASLAAYTTDAKDVFYKVGTFDNLGKNAVTVGVKYTF
ncbi:MAG: TorF family putative porin [Pseudomonadota bacterium]